MNKKNYAYPDKEYLQTKIYSWDHSSRWKIRCCPLKIRKCARMSILASPAPKSHWSPTQCNQARKINKTHTDWRERSKTLHLCSHLTVIYVGNLMESTKKLLKVIWVQQGCKTPSQYIEINCMSLCSRWTFGNGK